MKSVTPRMRAIPGLFLLLMLAGVVFSSQQVTVNDFEVLDWFKAVKLVWHVDAPAASDAVFQIYRSDKEAGPYELVEEIQLGDKGFIDVITKSYVFLDKELEVGRRYWYKLSLQGTDERFGPLQGLASGAPPGT